MQNHSLGVATVVSILVGASSLFVGSAADADWKADIGYNQLVTELGAGLPTGQGVNVTHVEALYNGFFRPDPSLFSNQVFNYQTASPVGISAHANVVGGNLYGPSSIAYNAGTGSAAVNVWEAGDWINNNLNYATTLAPIVETGDVANFSWKGTWGSDSADTLSTQRFDYSIQRDNYVAVVAVDNGSTNPLPNLLGQNYNAISVGITNGDHSHGFTTIDGTGRVKPDIVAPSTLTSYSAPMVTGAAALLLSGANSLGYADAKNSQVVKSILLAGATKSEFSSWSHTHTQPLDSTYGAGELNVERSYNILAGGEEKPSSAQLVKGTGWDFNHSLTPGNENLYFFDVPLGQTLTELSAVLAWNCNVTPDAEWGNVTTTLANLNLSLWTASGFTTLTKLDYSESTVDNVEHIYYHNLPAGRYALGVSADSGGADYALAWYAVPEPGTFLLLATCFAAGVTFFGRRQARMLWRAVIRQGA
jgi:hypothetical protein